MLCNSLNAENILIEQLQKHGRSMSLSDVTQLLSSNHFASPKRTAKEIIWKLIEEEVLRFNDDWEIELKTNKELKSYAANC